MNLKIKKKKKLSKKIEQVQNLRYGDHAEGYQLGGQRRRVEETVQGSSSIIGMDKIDRGMLRIV